jgi:hypothetical protein
MLTMDGLETFAAERRDDLDAYVEMYLPAVRDALAADDAYDELMRTLSAGYIVTFQDVADREPTPDEINDFLTDMDDAMQRLKVDPDNVEVQASRLATWFATATLGRATFATAARSATKTWITMLDENVRDTHADLHGEQRDATDTFTVNTSPPAIMQYPGQPVGPPEAWINCRCVLAVDVAAAALTAAVAPGDPRDTDDMNQDDIDTEEGDDEPPVPDELIVPIDGDQPVYGVMAPEGVESGDGRSFAPEGLEWRPLPLPLTWQRANDPEHQGSIVVGRVDTIDRRGNLLHWSGVLLDGVPEVEEVTMLIAQGALRGVSVDVDKAKVTAADEGDGNEMPQVEYAGRVSGLTIVQIPAFDEAYIRLGYDTDFDGEPDVMPHIAIEEEQDARAARELGAEREAASLDAGTGTFREFPAERRKKDAEEGKALPDGSFPIENVEDLRNAIQAIGRAKDPDKAKAHIRKRARELGHEELIPDTWSDDVLTFKRGPGWLTHPKETARIHAYWTRGKGRAKIRWGTGGDFTRCTRQLRKYIDPLYLNRTCAQWHHDALGYWPGDLGKPGNPVSRNAGATMTAATHSHSIIPLTNDPAAMFTLVAAAPPAAYPRVWFDQPVLDGPTPLTILPNGQVFGHLATWGMCHIGIDGDCVEAPASVTDYAYFKRGSVMTDGGEIRTGVLTMNTGHADTYEDFSATVSHYDHTGTGIADVNVGEDAWGIWVAGGIRDGVSEEQVRTLRAAGVLSGDWRNIGGNLELVAGLAVNVPGFPIPRASLAASAGRNQALVAAGVVAHDAALDVDTIASAVVAALDARQMRAQRIEKVMPLASELRAERIAKVMAEID